MSNGIEWFKKLENDDRFWIEKAKVKFASDIGQQLAAKQMTRSSFAEKLKKSAAYVTKLLRGDENLTIGSMVRIARALNGELHISIQIGQSEQSEAQELHTEQSKDQISEFLITVYDSDSPGPFAFTDAPGQVSSFSTANDPSICWDELLDAA